MFLVLVFLADFACRTATPKKKKNDLGCTPNLLKVLICECQISLSL